MSIEDFIGKATKRKKKDSEVKETDIEDHFCKFAKSNKCNALKLIMLRKKGFPDRTILCPKGRIFFIEFKKKGESQSAPQKAIQKILVGLGFEYHVCDQIGQAENILENFLAFDE